MVASAGAGALLLGALALPIPRFFGLLALANLGVAGALYYRRPFHLLRSIIWTLTRSIASVAKDWPPSRKRAPRCWCATM
jgi:hypothetical protein